MATVTWRVKLLELEEWARLQDQFDVLQMAERGPENLAMFVKGHPADKLSEIYMTGPGIETIERLSPEGWTDAGPPQGEGVSLLVGAGDPWTYFGIDRRPAA